MPRRIKRYENRKLYDTEASEYVSLPDIAEMVRQGETVEVIDNTSGRDLTAQTLTQIILEEGKSGKAAIPSDILHELLRRSEEALDVGIDQIRATVDDLVEGSVDRLRRLVQGPRGRELESLRSQVQHLEQQLSTLLDNLDAKKANGQQATSGQQAPSGQEAAGDQQAAGGATSDVQTDASNADA